MTLRINIFLFLTTVIFLTSCNKKHKISKSSEETALTEVAVKDTIVITDSDLVVFISPNSNEIETLKQKHGEENFYIIADDVSGYLAFATEKLDNKNIKYIYHF